MRLAGKNSTLLVALGIFCLPSLLIVYFQLSQWQQQLYMEDELETQQLQTVSISQTDLNWAKFNKEAIIDGKLFDVKEYHTDGEIVFLTGLFDIEETEIKNKLSLIRKLENDEKKNSELAQHYFSILLFSSLHSIEVQVPYHSIIKAFHSEASSRLASIPYSVITPPPEA